ncbi:hypothetical protein MJG53_009202 [Ovis ammon polii x Ovis aries]|uniref:Uncharacterized protein n=1 Tax=Ovis ammon polii x Ovis aries TaxID=2918886 RepID=A0ACB9UZK7_9CETA|nr:hypothetical protein MJG53_009202 [Ovis ammon polii x Ovis aries]
MWTADLPGMSRSLFTKEGTWCLRDLGPREITASTLTCRGLGCSSPRPPSSDDSALVSGDRKVSSGAQEGREHRLSSGETSSRSVLSVRTPQRDSWPSRGGSRFMNPGSVVEVRRHSVCNAGCTGSQEVCGPPPPPSDVIVRLSGFTGSQDLTAAFQRLTEPQASETFAEMPFRECCPHTGDRAAWPLQPQDAIRTGAQG